MRCQTMFLLVAMLCSCSHQNRVASEAGYLDHAAPARKSDSITAIGTGGRGGDASDGPVFSAASVDRKIIYKAQLAIVVDDFTDVGKRIRQEVEIHQGYIAEENLDRMRGERRSGRWTARIPVDQYQPFVDAMSKIGLPTSQIQNAQDVTEEFVDVQARIANKKKLEERIIELLDRPDDKIQHVIEVERELGRVREEIERMEGRLRFLQDQTAMTTVTISVQEEKNYQPPQSLTLSKRLTTAWQNSLERLNVFLQNMLVFLVGNAIVIALSLLFGLLILYLIRRSLRRLFARHIE